MCSENTNAEKRVTALSKVTRWENRELRSTSSSDRIAISTTVFKHNWTPICVVYGPFAGVLANFKFSEKLD
jgi:hypothetical protein